MNIILVPIIAWLLAIAYTHFEQLISRKNTFQGTKQSFQWTPIYVLIGTYTTIFLIQFHLFRNKLYDVYWKGFDYLAGKEIFFIIFGAVAFFIVLLLLTLAFRIRFQSSRTLAIILAGLILLSVLDMKSVGSGMWLLPSPYKTSQRQELNVNQLNQQSFTVPRIESEYDTISLSSAFYVGLVPNWYFNRYVQFLQKTQNELNPRKRLLGEIDGRKIYFSQTINHSSIQAFLNDAAQFKDFERVVSYTGDELTLDVRTPTEGYLSFIDNWNQDWKVKVDNQSKPLRLLFGTFKAVRLVPGEHRVTFAYRPGF
jgi:hypothetical protein